MPYQGAEPQTDIGLTMATIADADVATSHEQVVLICPLNVNAQMEALSVTVTAETFPTAANAALNFWDASGDSATALKAATDIVTSQTVLEGQQLWRGSQIMDAGDTLSIVLTGVTAGSVRGLSFAVEFRVLRHS